MSMMDFGQALAPPGDPGLGPPPGDQGPAPDQAQGPGGFHDSLDALDAAEEALHAFIQIDPDEADRAVAAQCLQNILKLKAKNQQEQQGGGGMTSLARALQGSMGPGGTTGPGG